MSYLNSTLFNSNSSLIIFKLESNLNNGHGSMGKLMHDDTFYNNLNQTVMHANALMAEINQGQGTLGMLAKDQQFQAKFRDTVEKLDSIMARVDSGQGTLGQLVVNPSLYNNADAMVGETRNLVTQIRENPKKYLTFHVKVF